MLIIYIIIGLLVYLLIGNFFASVFFEDDYTLLDWLFFWPVGILLFFIFKLFDWTGAFGKWVHDHVLKEEATDETKG